MNRNPRSSVKCYVSSVSVKARDAFTLVELLIVIGLLAILATTAVVVLNPIQLLAQARDAKRTSNIDTLDKLITVYDSQGGSFTNAVANTVYLSLPDDVSSTCGSHSLPSLPSPWVYACTTEADLRKTNGDGWIPLDFTTTPGLSVSALPVDPVNSDVNQLYYTFIKGSWNLTARLESDKAMKNIASKDKGVDPTRLESGSDKQLWTTASGLVGYWPMDEGVGTSVADSSGNSINGTISGSLTWRSGSECVKGNCIETTGSSSNNVFIPYNSKLNLTTNVTYINWVKIKTAIPASNWPVSFGNPNSHTYYSFRSNSNGTNWMFEYGQNNPTCNGASFTGMGNINIGTNEWHQLVATYDGSTIKTYLDGAQVNTRSFSLGFCNNASSGYVLAHGGSTGVYVVDEGRIYNRALSASEISAMYNAAR